MPAHGARCWCWLLFYVFCSSPGGDLVEPARAQKCALAYILRVRTEPTLAPLHSLTTADEATIAQIWRVSPADVTSVCTEVAAATGRHLQQQGLPVTSLAIRHMVSVRGLAQAQSKVATGAVAIVDGSFAALVANKLRSRTLYPPRAPADLQPACIVDVTCRPPPPPSSPAPLPAPAWRRSPPPPPVHTPPLPVRRTPPPPVHTPPLHTPPPPPPVRPRPSGNAALFLLGRDGCRSGGGWTPCWGGCMGVDVHGGGRRARRLARGGQCCLQLAGIQWAARQPDLLLLTRRVASRPNAVLMLLMGPSPFPFSC